MGGVQARPQAASHSVGPQLHRQLHPNSCHCSGGSHAVGPYFIHKVDHAVEEEEGEEEFFNHYKKDLGVLPLR